MTTEQQEKALLPQLTALIERLDYEVFNAYSSHFDGRGEFGIQVPIHGDQRARKVDLVAARWDAEDRLDALAIECKVATWAVYDGLGQAVQYQSLFDEVYVATPFELGADGLARSTLVDLGLGNITVPTDQPAFVAVVPHSQRPSRFEPHIKASYVTRRLALGLAFRRVAATPKVRFGFWNQSLSVWYAEETNGHLQWNCGQEFMGHKNPPYLSYIGINLEHAEDIRRILANLSADQLQFALRQLPRGYKAKVQHDPWPANPYRETLIPLSGDARTIRADEVLRLLCRETAPASYKPHFWAGWNDANWQPSTRAQYEAARGEGYSFTGYGGASRICGSRKSRLA
jgi:hypothetical protein